MGGGSKTTTSSKTTIPKEIRERGSTITKGAMGEYFDPAQKYQTYNYGNYEGVGRDTTGQLNQYHAQAGNQIGAAGNQYNQASQSYQPYFNAATSALAGGVGSTANQYAGPMAGASGYGGQTDTAERFTRSGDVNAGFSGPWNTAENMSDPNFGNDAISRFMNPYQQNVIDQGLRQIQDQMTQGRLQNQSRAALAGAFGGSRHGVIDAEGQKNAMTTMSDFVGSQLAQGYNQAVNQYNTDFGQRLQAVGQRNQAAGQNFGQGLQWQNQNNQAAQQNLQNAMGITQQNNQASGQNFNQGLSAQQLANQAAGQNFNERLSALQTNNQAAGQNYNQSLQSANFLQGLGTANLQAGINSGDAMLRGSQASSQLGNIYTAQDQAQKDSAYEKGYLDRRDYPMDVYERLAAINAMQPVNRTSTSTQSQSGGWLGPALGAVGSLMGSDENMKENIRDRDPEEALGAFAKMRSTTYSYTDEAKRKHPGLTAEGERRGFMAQDYEKHFKRPAGPTMADGTKTVDIPNLLGDVVNAITALEKRTRKLKTRTS